LIIETQSSGRKIVFRIRLLSPWREEYKTGHYLFSRNISFDAADALLCEWAPHDELLAFQGPKVWYNSEAVARRMFNEPKWERIKSNRDGQVFVYHAHPDLFYRVPMISFVEPALKLDSEDRIGRSVAVTSNCGNSWITDDIILRNAFATHPLVDLFGQEENWRMFMKKRSSTQSLPQNYKGSIKWPWEGGNRIEVMARYKVAICLENFTESYYVTEKFYAAVQAGCIPIYHAHQTVREGVLDGAAWVDPSDLGFDVENTLVFALEQDRKRYASQNFKWLETSKAQSAGLNRVFLQLGAILTRDL
jgi:hypothetical protein